MPNTEDPPRIDALLEQEPLREEGDQKLKAAIRTLGYVAELPQNQEATLASLRRLLCHSSTEKTSKVLEAGRHREYRQQPATTRRETALPACDCRARAQWRRGVSWGAQDRSTARVVEVGRPMSPAQPQAAQSEKCRGERKASGK